MRGSSLSKNTMLTSKENSHTDSNWQEINSDYQKYHQDMQKTISKFTACLTLKQQKTTLSAAPQEQETETTVWTGSPTLGTRTLEKHYVIWWVQISAATFGWYGEQFIDVHLTSLSAATVWCCRAKVEISDECFQHLVESVPRNINAGPKAKRVRQYKHDVPNIMAGECLKCLTFKQRLSAVVLRIGWPSIWSMADLTFQLHTCCF